MGDIGKIKFDIARNNSEGIIIMGYDAHNNMMAYLRILFHPTDTAYKDDEEELHELAKSDVCAAINMNTKEPFSDILFLEAVKVKEEFRRHGVGSYLIQKAMRYAAFRSFPLAVEVPPQEDVGGNILIPDTKRMFWFFTRNGYHNRAIDFAMQKHMTIPDEFYKGSRGFFYIPEKLRK